MKEPLEPNGAKIGKASNEVFEALNGKEVTNYVVMKQILESSIKFKLSKIDIITLSFFFGGHAEAATGEILTLKLQRGVA